MQSLLIDLLKARVSGAAQDWFEGALRAGTAPVDRHRLLAAYTSMSRKLGTAPLALSDAERQRVRACDPAVSLDHWGPHDVGRALLLLAAVASHAPDAFVAIAQDCYDNGDAGEQQSWLRALPVMPHRDRFVGTAVAACRTHIQPLFESIACENPYPMRQFPELNFNQMVLKSLFIGVPLARIVGLASRLNPELSRMAADYAREREAAGRPVPADIGLAVRPAEGAQEPGR